MIKRWYDDHYEGFWQGVNLAALCAWIFMILSFMRWAFDE